MRRVWSIVMNLYEKYLLPRVVHIACSTKPAMRQREKIVPLASGRVLEIGIGSGLNLPFYDAQQVCKVWGLEPSIEMTRLATRAAKGVPFELQFIASPAEVIPLPTGSIDTVLMTYVLCTIQDPAAALREMRRVIRRGGQLLFCEHGAAPNRVVRRQQDLVNPVWKRLGGGCNLNRPIPALIEASGFKIDRLEAGYIRGWRPASFNYWGSAAP
jgi:ubiquinone/menaquinone biosynthesis C-methylase UbiE